MLIQDVFMKGGDIFICIGDFKYVLQYNEKCGGHKRYISQLSWGRQTVELCGLIDFGFEGYPFTWSNVMQDNENIQCRLDRILAIDGFINMFALIKVLYLQCFGSYHATMRINLQMDTSVTKIKRCHVFRF